MLVTAIHHVQLAMPPGGEAAARAFYEGVLGIPEVAKPPNLAKRGGCWFQRGALKVHLGVETDFRPSRKAHPAFLVEDLPALISRISAAGFEVKTDEPLEIAASHRMRRRSLIGDAPTARKSMCYLPSLGRFAFRSG